MILHSKVAKLNQHRGDSAFERALAEIEAATDEGLEDFTVDVMRLDQDLVADLIIALEVLEYGVEYNSGSAELNVWMN